MDKILLWRERCHRPDYCQWGSCRCRDNRLDKIKIFNYIFQRFMWCGLNHTTPSNPTIHHTIDNNSNYNTRRGRWVFWELRPHSINHFVFPDCASEVLKGSKKHEDIPHGSLATISCTGGCIHFTKVYIIYNRDQLVL